MLVFMHFVFFLGFAHPHPGLNIDVVIYPVHVGIGVVDHIVFHIPHKAVAPQYIQRERRKAIDPFVPRKTAMRSVMHHIEPDGSCQSPQQYAFHDRPKRRRSEKYQMHVDKGEAYHQDHRLQKEIVIPGCRFTDFLEIVADPLLQFSVERMWNSSKFR